MNKEEFINECLKLNITITQQKYNKLLKYQKLLKEWNQKFNLTNIVEEKEVFLKHFYDSLCLNKVVDLNKIELLADVGTGAGFPGIVLKIVFDNIKVTLIEASTKKCSFLNHVIKQLDLKTIEVINQRGEIISRSLREKYDIVTCRAVSHLRIIAEISIPMLKVNGFFLPLKSEIKEELKQSEDILKKLNSEIKRVEEYYIPIEKAFRSIPIIIKKDKTSDEYPREYNKIVKTA